MVTQTNEQALEACIERALTGTSREQLKQDGFVVTEAGAYYHGGHGYRLAESADFDQEFAVDRKQFWNFLELTQAEELAKVKYKKTAFSRSSRAAYVLMMQNSRSFIAYRIMILIRR